MKKKTCQEKKVKQVMTEFKDKKLKSNKKTVKNPKQAIAIALSVARKKCK